jgi:hypothetical protein
VPLEEAPGAADYAFRPGKKARKYISEFNRFNYFPLSPALSLWEKVP